MTAPGQRTFVGALGRWFVARIRSKAAGSLMTFYRRCRAQRGSPPSRAASPASRSLFMSRSVPSGPYTVVGITDLRAAGLDKLPPKLDATGDMETLGGVLDIHDSPCNNRRKRAESACVLTCRAGASRRGTVDVRSAKIRQSQPEYGSHRLPPEIRSHEAESL